LHPSVPDNLVLSALAGTNRAARQRWIASSAWSPRSRDEPRNSLITEELI